MPEDQFHTRARTFHKQERFRMHRKVYGWFLSSPERKDVIVVSGSPCARRVIHGCGRHGPGAVRWALNMSYRRKLDLSHHRTHCRNRFS